MQINIIINNDFVPTLLDGVNLTIENKGTPSVLNFEVIYDKRIKLGNSVILKVDNKTIFVGFIFILKKNKENILKVTAYDQLRYLKNKNTYNYEGTLSNLIIKISRDFNLKTGVIEDSKYKLKRKEVDKTLIDMINNAISETTRVTGRLYVFYDDCGKLTLKEANKMKLNLLIDSSKAEDYDYSNDIDTNTYNKIKLVKKDDKGEKVVEKISDKNIKKWGVLQLYEQVNENENIQLKAQTLLKLHNTSKKKLTLKNVFGDIRVRAGSIVIVYLDVVKREMMVDKVTHKFENSFHAMDLTLKGGDFSV